MADVFSKKVLFLDFFVFTVCFFIFILLRFILGGGDFFQGQIYAILTIILVSAFRLRKIRKFDWIYRSALYFLTLVLLAFYLKSFFDLIIRPPKEWDFMAFYIDGYVARFGTSLFNPDNYAAAISSLDSEMSNLGISLSNEFRREVVEVGFKSPPFTAYALVWMSFFGIETARFIWCAIMLCSIAIYCVVLSHSSHSSSRWVVLTDTLATISSIVLSMKSTFAVLSYAQTSAFVALFLALAVLNSNKPISGYWSALAIALKPVGGIVMIFYVFSGKWRQVFVLITTILIVSVLSAASFGFDDWAAYFEKEYVRASPSWLYYQNNTTSLLAEIMRFKNIEDYPWADTSVMPTFFAISTILIVIAFAIVFLLGKSNDKLVFSTVIAIGLAIYPGTQVSYGIISAIPIVFGYSELRRRGNNVVLEAGFVLMSVALLNVIPVLAFFFIVSSMACLLVLSEKMPAK